MPAARQGTVWDGFPRAIIRPRVLYPTAGALAVIIGGVSLFLRVKAAALTPRLIDAALDFLDHSPLWRPILDGMEPARRAALPTRLGDTLASITPRLALIGLAAAPLAAVAVLLVGRFLAGSFERARTQQPGARARDESSWIALGLVFAVGFLAHLPFLRSSLGPDEASAALHATQSWWAWADTRVGWQTHIGGELLAGIASQFGHSEFIFRLPAALLSAAGLALAYSFAHRASGELVAVLTIGLLCALPLWAEQATLVRGYGVLFFGSALGLWSLWQLLDGPTADDEPRVLRSLFAAHLVGFLGHFFFAFFSLACMGLLAWRGWRDRSALSTTGAIWVALALVPGGLLYLPGLPATLYQSQVAATPSAFGVALRFVDEFGFRLAGPARWIAFCTLTALFIAGLWMASRENRRRALPILAISVLTPILLRAAYVNPRYFLHLLPLLFLATLPVAKVLEWLPGRVTRLGTAMALVFALWLSPRPWQMLPVVDLRGGCEAAKRLTEPGMNLVVDSIYVMSTFYFEEMHPRFLTLSRGIPPDADLLMSSFPAGTNVDAPSGFHEVERFPGTEQTIVIQMANRLQTDVTQQ